MICTIRAKILLLTFLFLSSISAQNYYVDKYATGSSDGSSWANAWTSIEDSSTSNHEGINWSVLSEGDTLFISGGMDSTTYSGTLTIGAAGTSDQNLVITKGMSNGHNGKVIIDGGGSVSHNISLQGINYVTVQYMTLRGATGSGNVDIDGCTGVVVDSLDIFADSDHGGVSVKTSSGVHLQRNYITTPTSDSAQTDGIYSQDNVGKNFYHDNYIVISNTNPNPHCDGIQSYRDTHLDIYNNYIEQDNSKSSNAQGVYIEIPQSGSVLRLWNNIMNHTQSNSNGLVVRSLGNSTMVEMIGNTVYGETGSDHSIWLTEMTSTPRVKNNIIHFVGTTGTGISITGAGYNSTSHNLQSNTVQVRGSDAITSDPLFTDQTNADFTLQPGSPAIDAGTDLGSPYNLDKIGISRPQFAGYDIGAHENSNRIPVIDPISNQNMNENDSLELLITASDPDGNNITLTVENLPTFGTFYDNGGGTGIITFTPDFTQSSVYLEITVMATDDGVSPSALSDTVTFNLIVESVNRAPVIEAITDLNMYEGDSLDIPIISTDPDGDNITLIIENLPVFGIFKDNGDGTGIISFTPAAGDTDVYSNIRVITNDDGIPSLADTTSFTLTVDIESIIDPGNLSASALVENEVELSWADNSNNEDGFIIEREIPETKEYPIIASVSSNVTNYADTSVADGKRYNYKVKAYNSFTESGYEGPVQVVTFLPAPSNLTAQVFNSPWVVQLDWIDNSDSELGFVIIKKDTTNAIFFDYDTVSSNITTYTDINVNAIIEYLYKVYAFSIDTVSDYSDTAQVIVPVELASFTASVTGKSVNVLWTTTTELNNRGFEIERMIDNDWENIIFIAGKVTTTEESNYQYSDDYKYISFKGIVQYRLKQIDFNGTYEYSDIIEVNVDFMPKEYFLYQNYPNPFNPSTKIKYALPQKVKVNLIIYNVIGEVVIVLVDEVQEEGFHEIHFDTAIYKSGVYFYKLQAGDFVETKKMVLLR